MPPEESVFDRPDVVAHYGDWTGLDDAESHLFAEHLTPNMRVLDLGVGGGRTTPALRALGGGYVGIDYSEPMVARARAGHPDTDIRHGDAADLSAFDDASFDAVVFSVNGIDYLHPRERRQRCVREVGRVLRPGGVFILSSHNCRHLVPENRLNATGPARVRRLGGMAKRAGRLCRVRLLHAPFWRGSGYVRDPLHWDTLTYETTSRRFVREIESAGFELAELVPATYPRTVVAVRAPWYYAAFRRV